MTLPCYFQSSPKSIHNSLLLSSLSCSQTNLTSIKVFDINGFKLYLYPSLFLIFSTGCMGYTYISQPPQFKGVLHSPFHCACRVYIPILVQILGHNIIMYVFFVSWCYLFRLKGNYTAQEKGDMGKRTDNRAPNPEPVTYALTRSFSHASHGIRHTPSSHIAPYVPVTGVPNPRPLKTRDLKAGTCMLDGNRPASLRWKM